MVALLACGSLQRQPERTERLNCIVKSSCCLKFYPPPFPVLTLALAPQSELWFPSRNLPDLLDLPGLLDLPDLLDLLSLPDLPDLLDLLDLLDLPDPFQNRLWL